MPSVKNFPKNQARILERPPHYSGIAAYRLENWKPLIFSGHRAVLHPKGRENYAAIIDDMLGFILSGGSPAKRICI